MTWDKGSTGFEAYNRVGVDSTRSMLKGNGDTLSNLEDQAKTGR